MLTKRASPESRRRGIRFGSHATPPPSGAAMTTTDVVTQPLVSIPRQRDRRRGLTDLAGALARALGESPDLALMRGVFEEQVRRAVNVRTVRLRDGSSRWTPRVAESTDAVESVAFEVAGSHRATPGSLDASFDPGCRVGEWDFQMLKTAAHIGALVLEIDRARLQVARLSGGPVKPRRDGAAPLIGSSAVMAELRSRIERVAATDFTVLLEGESGVGKELVARQIHELSRRRSGPFVAINCAALVETLLEAELFGIEDRTATGVRGRRGKFEHADGGTLFLDEVSDLSLSAQAKLLRA
ncbi:MAG: hypothetical protein GEU82_10150, partial [Luteitalea sp.]|nr:hypothetical protein [Luteitalea sp.]